MRGILVGRHEVSTAVVGMPIEPVTILAAECPRGEVGGNAALRGSVDLRDVFLGPALRLVLSSPVPLVRRGEVDPAEGAWKVADRGLGRASRSVVVAKEDERDLRATILAERPSDDFENEIRDLVPELQNQREFARRSSPAKALSRIGVRRRELELIGELPSPVLVPDDGSLNLDGSPIVKQRLIGPRIVLPGASCRNEDEPGNHDPSNEAKTERGARHPHDSKIA